MGNIKEPHENWVYFQHIIGFNAMILVKSKCMGILVIVEMNCMSSSFDISIS